MNVGWAEWRGRGAKTGAGSAIRSRMSIWGRTVDTVFTACTSSPVLTLIGLVYSRTDAVHAGGELDRGVRHLAHRSDRDSRGRDADRCGQQRLAQTRQ